MHYKIYKILFASVCFGAILNAQNLQLLDDRASTISTKKAQIENDTSKLKLELVSPLVFKYAKGTTTTNNTATNEEISTQDSESFSGSWSQPIFRSGGIIYGVKYANALELASKYALELEKKELKRATYELVLKIKQLTLNIKKQRYQYANSKIDVKIKKESVFNGLLDTSTLNNAILVMNSNNSLLEELIYSKQNSINILKTYTNQKYNTIKIPSMKNVSQKEFIEQNLILKNEEMIVKSKRYLRNTTVSSNLPAVNFDYSLNQNLIEETSSSTVGLSVSIALGISSPSTISSQSKSIYLAQKSYKISKLTQISQIKSKRAKIQMINNKIKLTRANIKSYGKLVSQMKELFLEGIKTKDDVELLKNSKKAEVLSLKTLAIDIKLEKLSIYSKMSSNVL